VSAASFEELVIIGPSDARSAPSGMRLPIWRRYATSSMAFTKLALTYTRCGAKPRSRPQLSISAHELTPPRAARKRCTARTRAREGKRAGSAFRLILQPRNGRTVARTRVSPPERTRMRRAQRSAGGSSMEQSPAHGRWKLMTT
jgi:hypothetical protein